MIVVDTSVWIEFFKRNAPIYPLLQTIIEQQRALALEGVFGELLQGAKTTREVRILRSFWQNLPKREEAGLWVEAGTLSAQKKLFSKGVGLIDAYLVVYAETYGAQIWSLDKKLISVIEPKHRYAF